MKFLLGYNMKIVISGENKLGNGGLLQGDIPGGEGGSKVFAGTGGLPLSPQ